MATKSTGAGRGGARRGAGRKPKAPPAVDLTALQPLLADKSIDALMEFAVRMAAAENRWDDVSKRGARLLAARARLAAARPSPLADPATAAPSRFAPRPAPKPN